MGGTRFMGKYREIGPLTSLAPACTIPKTSFYLAPIPLPFPFLSNTSLHISGCLLPHIACLTFPITHYYFTYHFRRVLPKLLFLVPCTFFSLLSLFSPTCRVMEEFYREGIHTSFSGKLLPTLSLSLPIYFQLFLL